MLQFIPTILNNTQINCIKMDTGDQLEYLITNYAFQANKPINGLRVITSGSVDFSINGVSRTLLAGANLDVRTEPPHPLEGEILITALEPTIYYCINRQVNDVAEVSFIEVIDTSPINIAEDLLVVSTMPFTINGTEVAASEVFYTSQESLIISPIGAKIATVKF